jgi:ribosomal protein S18 acetylase RimI-like enzyme
MTDRAHVFYALEPALDVAEFRRVLMESGLGAIRPVDDPPRLQRMLSASDLVVTARLAQPDGPLVGVARGLTDFSWCCYLSELAVSPSAQGLGIGKGLLDEARRQIGPEASLFLNSIPDAASFYERIGMERQADSFFFRRER